MTNKTLVVSNEARALRPFWTLIPNSTAIDLRKKKTVTVSADRPEIIAQILAAMTVVLPSSFNDPKVWFTIKPGVKLSREKQKYVDSIKPVPAKWRHIVTVFEPNPKLLWIARDRDNGTHYQYAQSWEQHREHAKTLRVLNQLDDFATRLDHAISTSTPEDSLALRVMRACPLRIGSHHSKSYGLTTFQPRHLQGKKITFVGKSDVVNTCDLQKDAKALKQLNQLKRARSSGVPLLNTTAPRLREVIQNSLKLSPKDFRTLEANRIFMEVVRSGQVPSTVANRMQILNDVAAKVATALNNTPSIARKSYVSNVLQAVYLLAPGVIVHTTKMSGVLRKIEKSSPTVLVNAAKIVAKLKARKSGSYKILGVRVVFK